jgi:hypothetical protein
MGKKSLVTLVLCAGIFPGYGTSCEPKMPSPRFKRFDEEKLVVDYFFSPSLEKHDSGAEEVIKSIEQKHISGIEVRRSCIDKDYFSFYEGDVRPDEVACRRDFGQDSRSNSERFLTLGGRGVPSIFVSGDYVGSKNDICRALGYRYGIDCLR